MRLKQIIINLIGNAIKFTPKGEVEVIVSKVEPGDELKIKVSDTGVGIPDHKRSSLFKAFEQVDTSSKRLHQGTGLGLVLSKELAQAMGGDVDLEESIEGKGSTFCLSLPCEVYKGEEVVESLSVNIVKDKELTEPADLPSLIGIAVLVVDDAKENARLFKMYLQDAGATVHVAHSGDECIAIVEKEDIDFVFLDIQMPGKDGYETLKILRKREHRLPVAALTAHAMKEERERTQKAGFDAHISKPVSGPVLLKTVKSFVSA
jgi:CheY-like chemotaxis protein/anti-sigma regulatory factor (Ser/Thr protein kinase)